jgi:hypothetical protein
VAGPILAEHIDAAKEALIQSRTTHLDNLAHRLHEPRVARIVRPVLMGEAPPREREAAAHLAFVGFLQRTCGTEVGGANVARGGGARGAATPPLRGLAPTPRRAIGQRT